MPPKSKKKYNKMDPLDHMLHRPDIYIGSTRPRDLEEYISVVNKNFQIIKKTISYSPALLRIFIEPLSNAIDNVARSEKTKTPCTTIKVKVDIETGSTSVWNDGDSIAVEYDNEHKCYNHSLIFGQLLTSSNYNDEEDRYNISGRNGVGAKATNVFSKYFAVNGLDPVNKKNLFQEWTNNMKIVKEPEISNSTSKKGHTEVCWIPDFKQFGISGYTQDIIDLFCRYVVDTAMLTNVNVYFNDVLIPVKNLKEYSKLYSNNEEEDVLFISNPDSQVVIIPSYQFQYVSFVNGVYTSLGGSHVDAWVEAAFRPLVQKLTKPKSSVSYTIGDVKKFFKIFVVVKVINPEFESQSKHRLESPVTATIKTSHINTMLKWSVMDDIQRSKEFGILKKLERKKKNFVKIDGLDPANNEGGKLGHECTLILVEGLAAKTYAVKGIEVGAFGKTGRDWFGIFCLKGKVLNVRNAKVASIAKNIVVSDIIKALGAKIDADYTNDDVFTSLRYGRILIITDADCVAHDTPVLTKNRDEIIGVTTIDSLNQTDWINDHSMSDLQVWSNNEWTNVLGIRRKITTKNIYRIVTHTGIIDVTEDHKLITENGNEIYASDCKIGDKLMHSFPLFYDDITNLKLDQLSHKELCGISSKIGIRYYQKKNKEQLVQLISTYINSPVINVVLHPDAPSVDEAYVMGLFWADGTSGTYSWDYKYKPKTHPNEYTFKRITYSWAISNTNYEFLLKSLNILAKHYDYDFKIIDDRHNHAYKLIVNGGIKTKEFVEKYTNLFYDKNRNKKIPEQILNSSIETRELFFKGFYDGDGDRKGTEKCGIERFDICGKIGSHGMFLLCKSLGYKVSVNNRLDKPTVYTLVLTKGHQQKDPLIIKKIINLSQTNNYVYDIETSNHTFQGGIGQLISHNCDGIHISGLLQNMIHTLFPTLLERAESFITSMQTPIVRVFLPGKKKELLFYDEREYQKYVVEYNQKNPGKKIDKKYYKGLGSSSDQDIVDTFGVKMIEFQNDENTSFNMNKIFHAKQSDARKIWLENYDAKEIALSWEGDQQETIPLNMSDFLNTEMIKFSINDCKRSIPCLMDGLKESHRKTLYACFKRNLKYSGKSLKVAQLAGYVAEHTAYHHGEQNLYDTITRMANSYTGSNNIPLLYRDGQYGTRLSGGKDAANARYIFTKLDGLTRLLFRPEDDILLDKVVDDGDIVEPVFYAPILPTILINGCVVGIGTGWSCSVPCYNPIDLIASVKIWLENNGAVLLEEKGSTVSLLPEITPWYRGFTGEIEKLGDTKFISWGRVVEEKKTKVVDELPIGMWTDTFKEYLDELQEEKVIKKVKNYSTPKKIRFVITEENDGIVCNKENLKLHKYIYTSNMVLFDENGFIKKYDSIDEIINSFCKIRFEYYIKRKKYILDNLNHEIKFLGNKKRFLEEVMSGDVKLFDDSGKTRKSKKTARLIADLESRGYDKEINEKVDDENENNDDENETQNGYDYLLRLQFRSITEEKIDKLKKDIASNIKSKDELASTSEKELWIRDLDEFEKAYYKWLKIIEKEVVKTKKK